MSKWTEVPAGDLNGAIQRLQKEFGDHADEIVRRINIDPMFVNHLGRFMRNGGYTDVTSKDDARRIMGENFFGVGEAIKRFDIGPTRQQLAVLEKVPFSESVLRKSKNTHILVAVFPLSILDIRDIVIRLSDRAVSNFFASQAWYENQIFAIDRGDIGWQLVRKEPVAHSFTKSWNDQQDLHSADEETPMARIMVYTIIGHFILTGKRLFKNVQVRCADAGSNNSHISVGSSDIGGLDINCYHLDNVPKNNIGLAACKK